MKQIDLTSPISFDKGCLAEYVLRIEEIHNSQRVTILKLDYLQDKFDYYPVLTDTVGSELTEQHLIDSAIKFIFNIYD